MGFFYGSMRVTFYGWIRAEGLVEVLQVFSEIVSWKEGSTEQRRGGSVRFKGITGGVQDFGVELKY